MAEKAVRKTTTTKRSIQKTTSKVARRNAVPVKNASKPMRKAPARVSATMRKNASKSGIIFIACCLLLAGAGVGIGYTDGGHIDVSSVIVERKQKATPEEQKKLQAVPVQQTRPAEPNGGLVGTGKSPAPVVQKEVEAASSTTGSSSPAAVDATDPAGESQEASESEPTLVDGANPELSAEAETSE